MFLLLMIPIPKWFQWLVWLVVKDKDFILWILFLGFWYSQKISSMLSNQVKLKIPGQHICFISKKKDMHMGLQEIKQGY